MLDDKIENTAYHYKETLKVIRLTDIEPAIAVSLADFKTHSEMGEFLSDYFKNSTSKSSKAFNLQK